MAQAPQSNFADVNGVKLHYLIAGKGDPVVLLHGFAETSHMWLPLIAELADRHTVIAPDLRGFGQSSAPDDGYTKESHGAPWRRTSMRWCKASATTVFV
jgi:pimeloyl-ACP methyl ester carboxylesterase